MQGVGWRVVLTTLDWKWSPQQIAGTLKRVFPNEPERHVSHETIYKAIYAQPRGELRRQLVACLRRGHSTRTPRTRGDDRRGQIPDMVQHPRGGCGRNPGLVYAAIPRLSQYSRGLREPREILIRFSLSQRMYESRACMNCSMVVECHCRG